eukprot:COSAG01_NODE_822_length_13306_cov_4.866132_8_plen_78_part_00
MAPAAVSLSTYQHWRVESTSSYRGSWLLAAGGWWLVAPPRVRAAAGAWLAASASSLSGVMGLAWRRTIAPKDCLLHT